MSYEWSICLHYIKGIHLECIDNCLFVSIMSWVLIRTVLSLLYLSPLCHGYSLGGCFDDCLFVSIMSWVLIESVLTLVYVSPICHGYSWWCLDNCHFVSIMSWVLVWRVLTIVFCLNYVMGTHCGVLTIVYLSQLCHR